MLGAPAELVLVRPPPARDDAAYERELVRVRRDLVGVPGAAGFERVVGVVAARVVRRVRRRAQMGLVEAVQGLVAGGRGLGAQAATTRPSSPAAQPPLLIGQPGPVAGDGWRRRCRGLPSRS